MNKSELIDAIAQSADISKAAAGKALDGMVAAVTEALKSGDTVTLVGFGTFYVGERAERKGRNPKTGEESPSLLRNRQNSALARLWKTLYNGI